MAKSLFHVRPLSLPAFRLLRKHTQYHSRSSSTGRRRSAQLNAASYVADAYSVSSGRKVCSVLCSASDAGSIDGRCARVVGGLEAE
jgi:hypothetical protein